MMHRQLPLHIDLQLIIPVIILLVMSLVTLFSIDFSFFRNQLLFTFIGIVTFFVVSQIDYKSLQLLGLPLYIGSIIILIFVLFLGFQSRGAVRWFTFFGFSIQFSEILKPLLAIALASFLSLNHRKSKSIFLLTIILLFPIAFLIYRQPDLGNALIYIGSVILTLIFFGFSLRFFAFGMVGTFALIPFVWQFLHTYQRQRLLAFFHFVNEPLGISYNAIQSVIAVGSGSLFGKGLGQGTQSVLHFLPERQTDFIFATLSEELGLIGECIVIAAFSFLLYRLFVLFQESDETFPKVFIGATFSLMLIQFFINVGMNIGMLPIVGVTLPFVSYGGSSLVSNAIFLGVVSSFGIWYNKQTKI